MKTNIRKKILITLLSLVTVVVLLIIGIVLLNLKIKNTEKQINEFLLSLENKSCRNEDLRSALAKIRDTQKKVEQYNSFLFKKGNELQLITDLENIALKNNVSQNIINSNLDSASGDSLQMTLDISGTYENALKYLLAVERHPYFLSVENLELYPTGEPTKEMGLSSPVNLRIHINLYAIQ
ncbi:MAG: hypothetical protein COU29_02295 [Candidatus Magasanikbacteria bacterium CG10_big_fil_rev_8_21_14_0_10_36_32]|uniref:Type 4a pilus biogenesis protein PilO n=1 Tax=Candidatus Magasanikbacteria bacterium CG10_big_fil_rev_8_21_14_0_10_36_32 TaxID=1974646 RepID=A0A2M6W777_9BACT|nr:MAG: hypothetical protein COU29_02295 [Candidatus Magasanikbacteria bacterium CG10_big_fil_rev_8_21_14_0_10_36_32]